jgi:two-component system NtrC family sensor kinase
MNRIFSAIFGGRLQNLLVASFVFVAVVTAVLSTVVISRVINDYLTSAQGDRVGRDMELANGLYQEKLKEVQAMGQRLANDPQTIENLRAAVGGNAAAQVAIDQVIGRKVTTPALGSSEFILILDRRGQIVTGRVLLADGQLSDRVPGGNWGTLPIIADALATLQPVYGTEVIPASYLAEVGLSKRAYVELRDTPQSAPAPFDNREGTAGLALVSVHPLLSDQYGVQGLAVTGYLFNNDVSFVDYLVNVAKIETSTVFLGDLRVATNVVDANGTRALGTRVSQAVYDPVLQNGQNYFGRVFVVTDWYIGRYQPLRDHQGNIVGMLYVGAREAAFRNLIDNFTSRVILIALVCIAVAGVLAIPISRSIAQPVKELASATHRLAGGDMNVRVEPYGEGEFALLAKSFNDMAETLSDTQQELLRKDKLASMGQLAAGVAHELNNPLGTILLYSDAMYRDAAENDARREDLEMIISEAQRCKIIVADLLDFARQHEVMAEDTDLNALLEEVVRKVGVQSRFEQVQFDFRLDPQLPGIQADSAQLQQVFINLLNNSADAISGAGTITITTKSIEHNSVEVRVADSGSGMSPESLAKLFTPFFTTKRAGKGTGLGLAIVYGIVKMHRGQIHVDSKPGQGTTMIITLPVCAPEGSKRRSSADDDIIA